MKPPTPSCVRRARSRRLRPPTAVCGLIGSRRASAWCPSTPSTPAWAAATPVLVGTVSGDPPPTTFTVTSPVADAVYFVTTTVADSETEPRSSPPSDPAALKYDQTITFGVLPNKLYGIRFHGQRDREPFGPRRQLHRGRQLHRQRPSRVSSTGVGSCTITASQPGNQAYYPAPGVTRTFAILETQTAQTITFSALPNRTLWGSRLRGERDREFGVAGQLHRSGQLHHQRPNGPPHRRAAVARLTASQAGNDAYEPAPPVNQSFTIIAWTIEGFHSPVTMPENGTARLERGQGWFQRAAEVQHLRGRG